MSKVSIRRGVKMREVNHDESEVSDTSDMPNEREPKRSTESQ